MSTNDRAAEAFLISADLHFNTGRSWPFLARPVEFRKCADFTELPLCLPPLRVQVDYRSKHPRLAISGPNYRAALTLGGVYSECSCSGEHLITTLRLIHGGGC